MNTKKYKIFNLIINEDSKRCKVILGNNLIDECKTEHQARKKIDSKPWDYIFKLIIIVVNNVLEMKKKEENNENKN